MSAFNSVDLVCAARKVCEKFAASSEQLNDLDSQLGDGDLGTTLAAISAALQPKIDALPDDIGKSFSEIAKTIAATSGSSFSAITMFGLLKVAAATYGQTSVAWGDVPDLIDLATQEMADRGGAEPGDKTILDGLAMISEMLRNQSEPQDHSATAKKATAAALLVFKDKPSKIGRARIAGNRSVSLDDPGMYALHLAASAL